MAALLFAHGFLYSFSLTAVSFFAIAAVFFARGGIFLRYRSGISSLVAVSVSRFVAVMSVAHGGIILRSWLIFIFLRSRRFSFIVVPLAY